MWAYLNVPIGGPRGENNLREQHLPEAEREAEGNPRAGHVWEHARGLRGGESLVPDRGPGNFTSNR